MKYTVRITERAMEDLREIHDYIGQREGFETADAMIERLAAKINSLESLPFRGNIPPETELLDLEVRELHEPPHRIIYEVIRRAVYVYRILDARRNVYDILAGELFRKS